MVVPKNIDVRIDRNALRKALAEFSPAEKADWCVACGAGSASVKLDTPMELVQSVGRDILESPDILKAMLGQIEPDGARSWCVACGAGAASPAADYPYLGENIPDSVIDGLSERLIGAVKVR